MRKLYKKLAGPLLVIMAVTSLLTVTNNAAAQSCNMVDIVQSSPDCLNQKDGTGAPAQESRDCKAIAVCLGEKYPYSASGTWATYLWTVSGPSPIVISPNNTPTINITWPAVGIYTLTLTVTDGSGNTFTQCMNVTVKDKPVANFTFTPNNVCAGSTIYFTNTTTYGGPVAYAWDFGDGNYSNAMNPTHVYATDAVYDVTLVAYSFSITYDSAQHPIIKTCCADTIRKKVTIKKGTFKIECVSTVCAGDTATYHAVGCANTTWLPPVGGNILSQTPTSVTIIWGNGNVQGQVVAYCPGGCTTSIAVPIIPSNPLPVGNISPCNNSNTSYTLPVLPGTFYTWHLDNISTPGNYDYALSTYPDNNTVWVNWNGLPVGTYELSIDLLNKHICCGSSGKLKITIRDKFQANFSQTVCKGSGASLSAYPAAGSYNWQVVPATSIVPPSGFGTGNSFMPVFNAVGTYQVKAWETANTYCNSLDTIYLKITVVDSAASGYVVGPNKACPGSQYTYSASTPAPSGYYYAWTITPGGCFQPGCLPNTTGNSVNVLWNTLPGTVSMQLRRSSHPACASATRSLTVTAGAIGNVSGTQKVCVDDSYTYSLTGGTLPPGENVQWTITPSSLGSIMSGQGTSNPVILWHGQVLGNGPWTAVLMATSNCGSDTMQVKISKKPVATITQQFDICTLPSGATLTVNGLPGYTYIWSNGSTATSISNLTTPGNYWVDVINASCTTRFQHALTDPFEIRGKKECTPHCNGNNVNENLSVSVIKPGAGTFTYQWFTGSTPIPGNAIAGQNTPAYTTTTYGNFCVEVTYGSCKKFVAFQVEKICCPDINSPVINPVTRQSCNTYTFTGTSLNPGGRPITWDFGDGTPPVTGVNGVQMPHTFLNAGIYCVRYCVAPPSPNPTNCTGNCGTYTVVVPIRANFTTKLGCNGCVSVENLSEIYGNLSDVTFAWDYGDGSPINTNQNPAPHCYTAAGTYNIILTLNYNNGSVSCQSKDTVQVVYAPLNISMNTPVCTGKKVNMFSSPGAYVSYAWDFGDGFSAYTANTTHIYNTAGPYVVSLTVVDQLGNTCKDTAHINVVQGVTGCQLQPAYICPGQGGLLTAPTGTGYTYLWEQYVGGNYVPPVPNSTSNVLTVNTPGWYHVIITNTNGCVCISDSVEVKAATKPKAVINVSPSNYLCGPGNITLSTPNIPGYQYQWYANAIGGTPISVNMMHMVYGVSVTTNYFLVLKNEYGCTDTCMLTVYVNPVPAQPVISGSPGPKFCEGTPHVLTVTNYASGITWNTGATGLSIVVSKAGVYTATYTNPTTGCTSSKDFVINRRPSVDLFPHYCDSIPCNCRKDSIFAPKPLIGIFAGTYNYQWLVNGIAAGSNTPYYTPAPAGSYAVVITDPATGCFDSSETYTITLPPCDTCNCSKSEWKEIYLALPPLPSGASGGSPMNIKCDGVYELKCNQTYNINALFSCADKKCPPKVTFSLQPPTGSPIPGTLPYAFTPTQNGTYTLTLYGWCGDKICDTCVITFKVKCDPTDCCTGSYWKEGPYWKNEKTGKTGKIDCKQARPIVISGADCNAPFVITGSFVCATQNCPSNVVYTLYNAANTIVVGPSNNTITIPTGLPNGSYYLTIYAYCGTSLCDTCRVPVIVDCKVDGCNCERSYWGDITLTPGEQPHGDAKANINIPVPGPGAQKLDCKKNYEVKCNTSYVINANYICAGVNCPGNVTYQLTGPAGTTTGNVPFNFTPTQSGTYTLTLYGWCNGKICDSCVITFKVTCDPTDCCKGSYWKESPYWKNERTGKTGKIDCKSDKALVLKDENCKSPFVITGSFVCATQNCPANVVYTLYNAANVIVVGPSSNTITIPTGLPNGNYYLTIYAYCGNSLCDSCRVPIKIDCKEEGCNCDKSYWGDITLTPGEQPHDNVKNNGNTVAAIGKKLGCDKTYEIKCRVTYNINANYVCAGQNCPGTVTYQLTGPMGTTTGNVPMSFTATMNGVYTLTLYGWCNGKICDSCVIRFRVTDCTEEPCCPYDIKVTPKDPAYTVTGNATQVATSFIINGLNLATITQVRANVTSYTITDNFNKECMKCVNLPFTWASTASANNIGPVPGKITLFGGVLVPSFNGSGSGVYQNPREVTWNNGTNFNIPNNTAIGMNFLLPPPPAIDCCELKGRICVKFIFRDDQCKECEVVACFDFVIKKK